jgi:type VI secretion system protein ImpM
MTLYLPTVRGAIAGFHGKLPVRGDFVRAGLPSSFVTPWDGWMARVLAGSQDILGEAWRPAWFEAPIWRFALAGGVCGPHAALGLFLPSVDRAGRLYPLTLAVLVEPPVAGAHALAAAGGAFLAAAQLAGLDALEQDLEPDILADRIRAAVSATGPDGGAETGLAPPDEDGATLWWTDGGPRVPHAAFAHAALPGSDIFSWMIDAQMIDAQRGAPPPADTTPTDTEAAP